MTVLTIMLGLPTPWKRQAAMELAEQHGCILLREVDARREGMQTSHDERETLLLEKVREVLAQGRALVLDASLRAPKHRRAFVAAAKEKGYRVEAIFCNLPLERAIESCRSKDGSYEVHPNALQKIERHTQIPTYAEGFDRVEMRTDEQVMRDAADFFQQQEKRLVQDPPGLIRELERDGRLEAWLPELHRAIPIDQHNPHHRYTIYEHILMASRVVAGHSLKMAWTMLLHDIGKAYPGIKQFTGIMQESYGSWKKKDRVIIENGADIREGRDPGDFYVVNGERIPKEYVKTDLAGHFYEHENLGAQMSFRILRRFGYDHDFALEVATLIQFHMLMPRGIEEVELSSIYKWYEKVGPYAADLMLVRLADNRGK
jgi:predicted kinase